MTHILLKPDARIAIINRGEPAVRFLNAVADFNMEHETGLRTIALYTRPDQNARFVQSADEAWSLGEVTEPDPDHLDEKGQPAMKSPYLIYAKLRQGLEETRADGVWVGWGFVAEHAEFVDLCDEMGIAFIGPNGDSMRALGDKIGSKLLAEKSGVPVSPWSGGAVKDVAAAKEAAESIGYPLVIKATSGGGGRGIRLVFAPEELEEHFLSASTEAEKAFGDGTMFMEKMITDARHLEVQILADYHGNVWPVGVRDCSVQRRNQKVIEEGPAAHLTPEQNQTLCASACAIARASDYHNAGTAEFLYTEDDGIFYFMEMNTRLQVEHPVTEVTTGVDLVKQQIAVAMGHKLEGDPPPTRGFAIEVRLNAEDPYNQFTPSPGIIDLFSAPGGAGIRVDSGVETHSEIPTAFDSMIAKIIAFGSTRKEAIARMRRALRDTSIVVRDGTTNKSFLLELLEHPVLVENKVTTAWLDKLMTHDNFGKQDGAQVALIVAAIEFYAMRLHVNRGEFFQTVARGRTRKLPVAEDVVLEMKLDGVGYTFAVGLLEPELYRLQLGEASFDVRFVRDTPHKVRVFYNGQKYSSQVTRRREDLQVEVEGRSFLVGRDSGGVVKSGAPAMVLKVHVIPGERVAEGDPLVTLEAMKMEMLFLSPETGTVKDVFVRNNEQVAAGGSLVTIEPSTDEASASAEPAQEPVSFQAGSLPAPQHNENEQILQECRSFILGFDGPQVSPRKLIKRVRAAIKSMGASAEGRAELVSFFRSVFEIYFHIEFLFLKQVSVSVTDISSPEQNLFLFLQLLHTDVDFPAPDFLSYLEKALAHYEVDLENPVEDLEEPLIRMCYSHHNIRMKKQLLKAVHDAFGQEGVFSKEDLDLKQAVEWLIREARVHFKEIHAIAYDFYDRFFQEATFDDEATARWRSLDSLLDQLDQAESGPERESSFEKINHFPYSLFKYILSRFSAAELKSKKNYMEILLRRINPDAGLSNYQVGDSEGVVWIQAENTLDRKSILNLCIGTEITRLDRVMALIAGIAKKDHGHHSIVLDVYLISEKTLKDADYPEILEEQLTKLPKNPLLNRIRFTIQDNFPIPRFYHYRLTREGYGEKKIYRGISQFMARRFYMDRLQGFRTERLATDENISLFYCEAEENVKDQRLIAFGEVREIPPQREADETLSYPALRRALLRIMNSMHQQQVIYPKKESFYWNQIILYIRPMLHVTRREFLTFLRQVLAGYEQVHLEQIRIYLLIAKPYGDVENLQVEINFPADLEIEMHYRAPTTPPIKPLAPMDFQLALSRRRGINYPYEVIDLFTQGYFYKGEFEEYDLTTIEGEVEPRLCSVGGRPAGISKSSIVVGMITNFTTLYPEGMRRVLLLSDGNVGLGCLAETECRYVLAAIELAAEQKIPLEWFPISSGAKISMDSGTENLDWTARVVRKIVEFTQDGGEINIVVDGINVGAQSYWNAEATMLMHNTGCLIMTPRGCMVLTGKNALDYAGSVSAEDNQGIGGLERVMGPNGQAHYPAGDLLEACDILFRYYAVSYIAPSEDQPRAYVTDDPHDRNICEEPYQFESTPDFKKIGDIFGEANADKKKPFDMRCVMNAVADAGWKPLERWPLLAGGETTIVFDTAVGGICVSMIGIQSFPIKRKDTYPNDGPDLWSGGTLFPNSSKKLARALNAASGRRPVVVLANLSGFDGSPESLRRLQLEYGAEIGRAVVNFKGQFLFCILSRYHGGAYVVFSNVLNENLKAIALEGTFASVIGGAPAAAVVFPREVRRRALADPKVSELQGQLKTADRKARKSLQAAYSDAYDEAYARKQGEVAAEFDAVHTVGRARDVGSLDDIISPARLRPYLIAELKEGRS